MPNRIFGAAVAFAAVFAALAMRPSTASADDVRLTVTPAVQTVSTSGNAQANVQLVGWGPYAYGYRGYYRPYYGRAYYRPYSYYAPAPYYAYPSYGGYGYTYGYGYPAYGYGYSYPAYGGVVVRSPGVGVGIW